MPRARHCLRRLRRSAKVDVDATNPDFGGTVKLSTGLNGKIRSQNHFSPGPRASGRRLKGKKLWREVVKSNVVKELDDTWSSVRSRYRGIGKCGVGRSDHECLRRARLLGKNRRGERKNGDDRSRDD